MQMNASSPRCRTIATIHYPSLDFDILGAVQDLCIPAAISPLHTPEGEKEHIHIILTTSNVKSFKQWKEIVESIHCVGIEVVHNHAAYYDYLTHRNNPEKQQFPQDITPTHISGYQVPDDTSTYSPFETISRLISLLTSHGIYNVYQGMILLNTIDCPVADKNCYVKYLPQIKELLYWAERTEHVNSTNQCASYFEQ